MRDQVEIGVVPSGAPIDVEQLLQWAIAQTGYLPWRGVASRELEYDFGYTAIPGGVRREFRSSGILLRVAASEDVNAVIAEVKALEPRVAAVVISCARRQIRPACFVGVEPRKVAKTVSNRTKRGKRRHRKRSTVMVWDIDPMTIKLARRQYEAWRAALVRLVERLAGRLAAFAVTGPSAPARPWEPIAVDRGAFCGNISGAETEAPIAGRR